jgi:hypothetical protein
MRNDPRRGKLDCEAHPVQPPASSLGRVAVGSGIGNPWARISAQGFPIPEPTVTHPRLE